MASPGGHAHPWPDPTADARSFWDGVHGRRDPARPGRPHPVLAEAVGAVAPGTALELGCGDGANAIWLAGQGWTVTGVDVSGVALERAASHAERAEVADRVSWQRADLRDWTSTAAFDLVLALFLHTPLELDTTEVLARAGAARVRPGGALLVVGHFTLPPWAWDPERTEGLRSAAATASALGLEPPGWSVRRAAEVPRAVTGRDGEPSTVLDAVLHAVRAP
jgi:SAM-dependent methyltransferase